MRNVKCILAILAVLLLCSACSGANGAVKDNFPVMTVESHDAFLEANKGKPVFVCFWTTWCPACRQEIPELKKLQAEFGDAIKVIAISLDKERAAVEKFFGGEDPGMDVFMGTQDLAAKYAVRTIPKMAIYDKNGKLVVNKSGVFPHAMLTNIVNKLK